MPRYVLFLLVFALFTSCEKSIDFTPRNPEAAVVVEATIENDQPPRVILSKSLSFFSKITPEQLLSSFVRNAEVTISNGTLTHRLKEYEVEPAPGFKLYYYGIDSSNLQTAFEGEFGKTYNLTISTGDRVYTSSTTIPLLKKTLDSLWWEPAPDNPDTTKAILMTRTTDPPGYGDYVRYFTSTNGGPFFPGLASVFDDQIIDGKTYSIQVEKGVNRNEDIDLEDYAFFNRGDTVIVKLASIDKATFDFWRTIEFSYSSIGNPFSSPTKVISNIKGGGLGYFGGYAAQFRTIIIPK